MPTFSLPMVVTEALFGSIGFIAFIYGKRICVWRTMFIGLGLMVYPYFVPDALVSCTVGVLLTAALFLFRG
jgi:hypothetical protein